MSSAFELVKGNERFLRSINLASDYLDRSVLDSYILTGDAEAAIKRLSDAFRLSSTRRAWRLTGNYGTGKSSLALALAHIAQRNKLPRHLTALTKYHPAEPLYPILVTSSRQSLRASILNCLRDQLKGRKEYSGFFRSLPTTVDTDRELVNVLKRFNVWIADNTSFAGTFLVIDELGKSLEFSALFPESQDVFLLQELAEFAARSGESPFIVVALLHQGVHAYSQILSVSAQKEWEKVAGRFEEILLVPSAEQAARLLAAALNPDESRIPKRTAFWFLSQTREAVRLGLYGPGSKVAEIAAQFYPLDPVLVPPAIEFFRRFGQNERSIFNFLFSEEPFGLRHWLRSHQSGDVFTLSDFYDYVDTNFLNILQLNTFRNHWTHVRSVVESYKYADPVHLSTIKTIGLLNLIDVPSHIASEELVSLALRLDKESTRAVLQYLRNEAKILFYRGSAGGFCLWPHTSVNIDAAYQQASQVLGIVKRVAPRLSALLPKHSLIARRHYIQTGTLRSFEVRYSDFSEMANALQAPATSSGGALHIVLCETKQEMRDAISLIEKRAKVIPQNLLVGISEPVNVLAPLLQEVERWDWVALNVPELSKDSYASREVSRQCGAARLSLKKRAEALIGIGETRVQNTITWFSGGVRSSIRDGRALNSVLSEMCDKHYHSSPIIENELLNREHLSSAAAAARAKLIELMFAASSKPRLGIAEESHPPELSMYLSVLKKSNLHVRVNSNWRLSIPSKRLDVNKVRPALLAMQEYFKERPGEKIPLTLVLNLLSDAPFGVKSGPALLLLAILFRIESHQFALYEDNRFVPTSTVDEFKRMAKAPDTFMLQYCNVVGIRKDLFLQIKEILQVPASHTAESTVLDVVTPLCNFVVNLPEFVKRTSTLSKIAIRVRDSVLRATDPTKLLFEDLPESCQQEIGRKSDVERFSVALNDALEELKMAYSGLLDAVGIELFESLLVDSRSVSTARSGLSRRATTIASRVSDKLLKPLVVVLSDTTLPDPSWLEAVGSAVISKPPAKWNDTDRKIYTERLAFLCAQFRQLEAFLTQADVSEHSVQLTVLHPSGQFLHGTLPVAAEELAQVKSWEVQVAKLLEDVPRRHALAAIARLASHLLSEVSPNVEQN